MSRGEVGPTAAAVSAEQALTGRDAPDSDQPPVVIADPPPEIIEHTVRGSSRPPQLDAGLELVSVTEGTVFERSEHFLYEIYRQSGFCSPSRRRVVEELQPWRPASTYHVVIDEDGEILGTVRTILGDLAELPVGGFEQLGEPEPDPLCELSSLAVTPSERGSGVVEHLYRAGWLAAWRAGANALCGLVDPWLFEMFVDYYRLPFRQSGIPHFHMGAEVVPVVMPLRGPAYADLAATRPGFWEWTLEACTAEEIEAWQLPEVSR
jgi:predicted N-acetyltransferase YhbS